MLCPKCGRDDTKVLESRLSADGRSLRRRRICKGCDYRMTTYERQEGIAFHVKKRDGRVVPYLREKILRSIQIACQKRPVKIDEMEFLLGRVEKHLQDSGEPVVSSRQLGMLIMQGLNELDQVAYVRFASVYQDFKDPTEFYTILKSLH